MGRTRITAKVEAVPKRWMSKDKAEVSYARYGNKTYWYDVASIDRFIARNKVI